MKKLHNIRQKYYKITQISLKKALKGQEKLSNVIKWWGILAYVFCYIFINPLIGLHVVSDYLLSLTVSSYLFFHIFLLYKNVPKKPKLTKAQKKKLKEEKKKDRYKSFLRKLFLKEPIGKFKPHMACGAFDLLIITHYLEVVV